MIDWSTVEVGDVVEFRNGDKERVESFSYDHQEGDEYPAEVNGIFYTSDGLWWSGYTDDGDIIAIHKPGTVGALSHEERSRLWDKCEEMAVCTSYYSKDGRTTWAAWKHGETRKWYAGETLLEAVMKCVRQIEQQQQENANG